ncbi:4'-phosphopantetheinyl transferase superfamily protein [Chitinophaga sp. CF118]|uniref:4'-phosphopantetheinyl transferase family protein n=1 Tax=Chitinophaga sp. CF118 TaxID=1884367 RepID=UPI0008E8FF8D|nr:4'-phosphopantetheinyl transferase superfamily protein [Chitinophaga sp. CF118]SFE51849.1 4'-phosphopantetheinyl transferase superfamily protein [Chitinophaga sp. CF118]
MKKGEIILKRENRNFNAGFCIIKQELPDLINKIQLLHQDERNYFDTLLFDKRKADYLLGRIASKKAIGELTKEENMDSISIGFGIFQFPVVKSSVNRNIQVSISHCDNLGIALAFPEEHPLGVDIEKLDNNKIDVMRSQVCANEFDLISSSDLCLPTGYTVIWTIRESLSKIFRTGLTMDNKLAEIKTLIKVGTVYVSTFRHFSQYKAISCCAGDYVCSIVLPKNTVPVLDLFWNSFTEIVQE